MASSITVLANAFQEAFTRPDGTPSRSYYNLSYQANLPSGYNLVQLIIESIGVAMVMSPTMTKAEMNELFRLIPPSAPWGGSYTCHFEAFIGLGVPPVRSATFQLPLPLMPYMGPLTTLHFGWLNLFPFNYPGNGSGRVLTSQIGRYRFFRYGSKLETAADKRGLDCTTFPLALFELVNVNVATNSGLHIAQALKATPVDMENTTEAEMRFWFAGINADGERIGMPPQGVYLLWRVSGVGTTDEKGHVLLYKGDGQTFSIHQFNKASGGYPAGYSERCVRDQSFGGAGLWTARKIDRLEYAQRVINSAVGLWPWTGAEAQSGQSPPKTAGPSLPGGPKRQPAGGGAGSGGGAGGGAGGKTYTVVSGDSLSLIAGRQYNDVLLWPIIYDANRQVVGGDPNKIVPGQRLRIPDISGYNSSQLTSIRSRGRNC